MTSNSRVEVPGAGALSEIDHACPAVSKADTSPMRVVGNAAPRANATDRCAPPLTLACFAPAISSRWGRSLRNSRRSSRPCRCGRRSPGTGGRKRQDQVSVRANGRRDDARLQIEVDDLSGRLNTCPERFHSLTAVTARYVRDVPGIQGRVLAQSSQVWHCPGQKAVGCGIVQAPRFCLNGRCDRQRKALPLPPSGAGVEARSP